MNVCTAIAGTFSLQRDTWTVCLYGHRERVDGSVMRRRSFSRRRNRHALVTVRVTVTVKSVSEPLCGWKFEEIGAECQGMLS